MNNNGLAVDIVLANGAQQPVILEDATVVTAGFAGQFNAAVAGAKKLGNSAKESTVTGVIDTAKSLFGVTNIQQAYHKLLEERKVTVVEILHDEIQTDGSNKVSYEINIIEPSYLDRIKNASGEVSIAGVKISALSTFVYGGTCKLGTGLIPLESITLGDIATTFNNATLTTASYGYDLGSLLVNNILLPVCKNNIVNTAAVVSTTALFYSANNDWKAIGNTEFDENGNNLNGLAYKAQCAGSALLKGGLGVLVGLGTLSYNFYK